MRIPSVIVAMAVLASVACAGETPVTPQPEEPATRDEVVGDYEATYLTSSVDGVETDELSEGFSVDLVLSHDGTTSGELVIPEWLGTSADLAGTWTFGASATVTLSHPADTFLRDMVFVARRTGAVVELVAADVFSGTVVTVILTRGQ